MHGFLPVLPCFEYLVHTFRHFSVTSNVCLFPYWHVVSQVAYEKSQSFMPLFRKRTVYVLGVSLGHLLLGI